MIINAVRGDVFDTSCRRIAFAVNTEGLNDAGFAGEVCRRYWPELARTGGNQLGEVLTRTVGDRSFHAFVCHSLSEDGWKQTPELVQGCLDSLGNRNEPIAVVLMGSGMIGKMSGADVYAILGGMARSDKEVVVYTL